MNTVRLPALPTRLPAPDPGWSEHTDVVVVGSGIAGLTTALQLRRAGLHVTVVTKVNLDDGSTRWAQGGIAAVLDPRDTAAAHAADTIRAGVGLCDPAAVEVLVTEGPDRLRELIRFGAEFDRHPDGSLMLTREGGHTADRVAHAGGDATGAEVQRALEAAVRRDPWIRTIEHALVVDLLRGPAPADPRAPAGGDPGGGPVCGLTVHVLGEGSSDGVGAVYARAVVLATGGTGQIYQATTNPAVSTGDGVALALRTGAVVTDLEFLQFHPTALVATAVSDPESGQLPLITEALRGEGAHLVDGDGKRFMPGVHEMAELAPRDVVAKAITGVMRAEDAANAWLDARHLGAATLRRRFPTILASCRAAGVDPVTDLVPVAPAAHYASGGARTDLYGRTSVPGLYACGEAACTGVHGANRLASNSLLEALVFARRIATDIAALPAPEGVAQQTPAEPGGRGWAFDPAVREPLRRAMSEGAGVLRTGESLREVAATLRRLAERRPAGVDTATWETTNLTTVAAALVAAAYTRQETRGCHWRDDHADAAVQWRGRLLTRLAPDGRLRLDFDPLPSGPPSGQATA